MRIKVDEDLPRALTIRLRAHGHDAESVLDEGLGGITDAELARAAKAEERFLVTADKGFADIRMHAPGTHPGILLLRPNEDGVSPLRELLDDVLEKHDLPDLIGSVTVATPRGIRIRR